MLVTKVGPFEPIPETPFEYNGATCTGDKPEFLILGGFQRELDFSFESSDSFFALRGATGQEQKRTGKNRRGKRELCLTPDLPFGEDRIVQEYQVPDTLEEFMTRYALGGVIRPDGLEYRRYQIETMTYFFEHPPGSSLLLIAPTAAGKTKSAGFAVGHCVAQERKRALFTTVRKHLAEDIRESLLEKDTLLKPEEVAVLSGKTPRQREKIYKDPGVKVLVALGESLRNDVKNNIFSLEDLGLWVEDEGRKIFSRGALKKSEGKTGEGKNAYSWLNKRINTLGLPVRRMVMSATPGINKREIEEVRRIAGNAKVIIQEAPEKKKTRRRVRHSINPRALETVGRLRNLGRETLKCIRRRSYDFPKVERRVRALLKLYSEKDTYPDPYATMSAFRDFLKAQNLPQPYRSRFYSMALAAQGVFHLEHLARESEYLFLRSAGRRIIRGGFCWVREDEFRWRRQMDRLGWKDKREKRADGSSGTDRRFLRTFYQTPEIPHLGDELQRIYIDASAGTPFERILHGRLLESWKKKRRERNIDWLAWNAFGVDPYERIRRDLKKGTPTRLKYSSAKSLTSAILDQATQELATMDWLQSEAYGKLEILLKNFRFGVHQRKTLVGVDYQREAEFLGEYLRHRLDPKAFKVLCVHGGMKRKEIQAILEEFKSFSFESYPGRVSKDVVVPILITTKSILGIGWDDRSLGALIAMTPEKGTEKTIQLDGRVGRGELPALIINFINRETAQADTLLRARAGQKNYEQDLRELKHTLARETSGEVESAA